MLGTIVTGMGFFYTWAFLVVLFVIAGAVLVGGLFVLSTISLPAIHWSAVRLTIWPAIYAVILVVPTIVLVFLNLRRR